MGCGSSRAVVAVEPCKVDVNGNHEKSREAGLSDGQQQKLSNRPLSGKDATKTPTSPANKINVSSRINGSTGSIKEASTNIVNNPRTVRSISSSSLKNSRNSSASSRKTYDSGVYDSEKASMSDENIISENSHPSLKEHVETENRPATPELSVDGQKIEGRKSGTARHREALMAARKASASSQKSLQDSLRTKAWEKPESVAFDILLCPDVGNVKKKPEKLAKLQQQSNARRKKKAKKAATKTDIDQKLRDAEERRKNLEHEKQNKARALQRAAHSETPVMDLGEQGETQYHEQGLL